jgi:hypothetical protein
MHSKNYPTWILIIILVIYSVFTFLWLSILYISANGQSVCEGDSFPCNIRFPLTSQVNGSQDVLNTTNKQLAQQKIAKNKLKAIYEELAVLDDEMVLEQSKLDKAIKVYQKFIDTNVIFINKKPQVLPTLTEASYTNVKEALLTEMDSIKTKLARKAEKKDALKQEVDGLYNNLAERQSNNFIGTNENQAAVEIEDPNAIAADPNSEYATEESQ